MAWHIYAKKRIFDTTGSGQTSPRENALKRGEFFTQVLCTDLFNFDTAEDLPGWVRTKTTKRLFWREICTYAKKRSFDQDRLGTHVGNVEKREAFSACRPSCRLPAGKETPFCGSILY